MNILIISWRAYKSDGRLIELVNSMMQIGEVYLFSSDEKPIFPHHCCFSLNKGYLNFVKEAVRYGRQLENVDVVVMDDRRPAIPGMILKHKKHGLKTILDCRETYFFNDAEHLTGKIGCLIEKYAMKRSDIVVAANLERAMIMQERYRLKERPLVFENIRDLAFSESYSEEKCREKYKHLLNTDEYIILASSGCNPLRVTDVLVENFPKVKHKCRLVIAGWNSESDEQLIKGIIQKNGSENIEILGRVNLDELKFLTQHCDVGIVNYCQKDINYKYCASGKIYEFLFEGVPVVTTTNPPLKRMCDEGKIGVADDTFVAGIDMVLDNLEYYRNNAKRYARGKTVEENNRMLADDIIGRLKQF